MVISLTTLLDFVKLGVFPSDFFNVGLLANLTFSCHFSPISQWHITSPFLSKLTVLMAQEMFQAFDFFCTYPEASLQFCFLSSDSEYTEPDHSTISIDTLSALGRQVSFFLYSYAYLPLRDKLYLSGTNDTRGSDKEAERNNLAGGNVTRNTS